MNNRWKYLAGSIALSLMLSGSALAMNPVTLVDQGSFTAGGTVVTAPGERNPAEPLNPAGQTLHGDHAYVFYQTPADAHTYGMVFLHGAGQSGKTWETTPDGRDGFQNIFLEKGYKTYVVDQPRRGRAGQSTTGGTISNTPMEELWYDNFRIGVYPDYYDKTQFPKGSEEQNEFFRSMTPNTGSFDEGVVSDAMKAVFDRAGDGVLVTHSQGGGPGWQTAIKSSHVKGVIALEPGSGFVFPEGEAPEAMETSSPFGALKASEISEEDFNKLTRIPILVIYGDYIPEADQRTEQWNLDNWRVRLAMARLWVKAINDHGGDATLIHLPDMGIYGNTHFLMSDKNNREIADIMEKWMHEKNLDR
jgi:pimeloyl-ACP methyl ester carboxylesterase